MSDLNYGLGFYLIEVGRDQYDLFNSVTDKRILMDEPREKIVNFLELNLPTHPFLYQVDQETGLYLPTFSHGQTEEDMNKYFEQFDRERTEIPPADPGNDEHRYNLDNYSSTANYNYTNYLTGFYTSVDYDASYNKSFVESEDTIEEDDSVQLEFNFTYDNSKGGKTIPTNTSADNEDIISDYFAGDIPYLPDGTGGDTD